MGEIKTVRGRPAGRRQYWAARLKLSEGHARHLNEATIEQLEGAQSIAACRLIVFGLGAGGRRRTRRQSAAPEKGNHAETVER